MICLLKLQYTLHCSYCFLQFQAFLPKECFVEVPKLPEDDAARILVNWLSMANRTLSNHQQDIIKQALQSCSLPIFVRVTFDEAIRWKSYSPPDKTRLEHTVRGTWNIVKSTTTTTKQTNNNR